MIGKDPAYVMKPQPDAGPSDDGRGGFRTCDLSRVKRDLEAEDDPPTQGTLF
jgi:hypothetical protein